MSLSMCQGKAVAFSLTPGQRADITEPEALLDEADPFIEMLEARQMTPVIRQRKTQPIFGKVASHLINAKTSSNDFSQN